MSPDLSPKGSSVSEAAPIIWFADDWGRHPSSSQHLVRNLLGRRKIYWINTIGTRKPKLNLYTFKRGLEKLRHWGGSKSKPNLPANLSVIDPRMWPWFSHARDRWFNRKLLVRQLARLIAFMDEPPIVVTTVPVVADLVGRLLVKRWIYYCVDDFSTWPGLDGQALREMEAKLVANVHCVVSVSQMLGQRVKSLGKESELLTHGVDLDFWRNEDSLIESAKQSYENLPRPLITFWGVVDRRMDLDIVHALADAELGTILLIGPHNDPDPALTAMAGVVAPGPLPLEQLPGLARLSSVLIMPYADLPVTRAMQPLKLKEYLATGRPCVVRDLPANREWANCLDIAASPDAFVAAVKQRLSKGVPENQQQARQRLNEESWDEKARRFEQIIEGGGHE